MIEKLPLLGGALAVAYITRQLCRTGRAPWRR